MVGILDSNADPEGITYPVPGNDDAKRAIDMYCDLFAAAVLDGLQEEMQVRGVDMGALENPTEEGVAAEEAPAAAPRGKARKKAATA